MNSAVVPALAVAAAVAASIFVRARTAPVKLAVEGALVALLAGVLLAEGASPLPIEGSFNGPAGAWLRALAVIWWLVAARLASALAVLAFGRDAKSRAARLVSDLVSGGIYVTAALIVLNSVLDLPVRGLVATSGVVAIVLGLALQNTLADLFAGIAVGIEQPFAVGDRVGIGSQEGVVVEMNWRAVRLQTDAADTVTVPNSVVAKNEVVNRSRPTERRTASLEIPVRSSNSSGRLIELIDQALMLCPALLEEPKPTVALKAIDFRRVTFGVGYSVASSAQLGAARGQVLRQVRRLLRHGGAETGSLPDLDETIAELALFTSLTAEQRAQLIGGAIRRHYEPGMTVFEEGSVGAALFVTLAGVLDISTSADGARRSLGRVGPGEYLGEIGMMTGDPRRVTVAALTPSELLEVPRSAIEVLLAADAGLGVALERAVKRGAELIERDEAARHSHPLAGEETLLRKLRRFLHG